MRFTVVGGPWPDRIGCTGFTVIGPRDVYPWAGLGRTEVVVKLDDDPVQSATHHPEWSCVYDRAHLREEA